MSKPVLDTSRPFGTRREFGTNTKLFQDGHLFNMRHEYIGPDPNYQPPPEPEPEPVTEPSNGALTRASNLEGFAPPADLSDSKKEDARARAAERLAE